MALPSSTRQWKWRSKPSTNSPSIARARRTESREVDSETYDSMRLTSTEVDDRNKARQFKFVQARPAKRRKRGPTSVETSRTRCRSSSHTLSTIATYDALDAEQIDATALNTDDLPHELQEEPRSHPGVRAGAISRGGHIPRLDSHGHMANSQLAVPLTHEMRHTVYDAINVEHTLPVYGEPVAVNHRSYTIDPFQACLDDGGGFVQSFAGEEVDFLGIDSTQFVWPYVAGDPSQGLNIMFPDFIISPQAQENIDEAANVFQIKFEHLLDLYDRELCILPLTSEIEANPFRCSEQSSTGSRLLLHAILALCYQHISKDREEWYEFATEHKNKANALLASATQSGTADAMGLGVMDAILVLFAFDCASSALSSWKMYLNRAYRVLDACGGPTKWDTQRLRLQVGMLVWWDATLALISREGLTLPDSYSQYLLNNADNDSWSFYDLGGVPQELFQSLLQLSRLARENEIVSTMKWASFNLAPVQQLEDSLKAWTSLRFSDLTLSEETNKGETYQDYQIRHDSHHCAEAWRFTLLLYIQRVFKWDRTHSPSPIIYRLARKVLDHVRCCRNTSLIQKQLLIPVFLAGSELSDIDAQEVARSYCAWWTEKSRYKMFETAGVVLEEMWKSRTETSWWGSYLDEQRMSLEYSASQVNYLFG